MVSRVIDFRALKSATTLVLLTLVFLVLTPNRARAMAADEVILDSNALLQLENQAANAQVREQCFLYTEVLHSLTEIAGQQLAEGHEDQAALTFQHIDDVATKIQVALARDAKRLKNAEMLLEHTTRRLTDILHITSGNQHEAVQMTLQRVNTLHSNLLSQVFAK